jgi:hypothetical protein
MPEKVWQRPLRFTQERKDWLTQNYGFSIPIPSMWNKGNTILFSAITWKGSKWRFNYLIHCSNRNFRNLWNSGFMQIEGD